MASFCLGAQIASVEKDIVMLEVSDFKGEFGADWRRVMRRVSEIGRKTKGVWRPGHVTGSKSVLPTARVHLLVTDPILKVVKTPGEQDLGEFMRSTPCSNLYKATLPFVEELENNAFYACTRLCEINVPRVKIIGNLCFGSCKSLRRLELPVATKLGENWISGCARLTEIFIPSVTSLPQFSFSDMCDLRHVAISSDCSPEYCAFKGCSNLEILAAASKFELDNGGDCFRGIDPTVGVMNYCKWRTEMDASKKVFETIMCLTELCNQRVCLDRPGLMRATTNDPVMRFLAGSGGGDIANVIFSFVNPMMRGRGDLREASKASLLLLGLELKVLDRYDNGFNQTYWGAIIDDEWKVIRGGLKEVIARGLLDVDSAEYVWGLEYHKRCMGFSDYHGIYGPEKKMIGYVESSNDGSHRVIAVEGEVYYGSERGGVHWS